MHVVNRISLKDWIMRGLWLFSLSTLMFLYGFIAGEFRIFPFHYLRQAQIASTAIAEVTQIPSVKIAEQFRVQVDKPTVRRHAPLSTSPYVLVSAGHAMRLPGVEQPVMAWIIDRAGNVVHSWRSHPDLWNDLEQVLRVPGISGPISPAGFHLYPDGGLLATYHGQNTFPFAVGLARFDRHSNLLWKKELLTHHFFTLDHRGHIFVPGLELVDSPISIGNTSAIITTAKGKIYRDQIVELDPEGNEVERFGVLDLLIDSGRHGLLTHMNTNQLDCEDPTHLNDIRVLDDQQAGSLPGIEAGDLLISLRNLNTVAIVGRTSKRIKWLSAGTTVGQHSPRVFDHGILTLDNLGGDAQLGGTRLVHIDFQSGLPTTLFPKPGVDMPDVCKTTYSGHLDISPDGRHVLMCVTNAGAIWEVDAQTGQVNWEYLLNDPDRPGVRANIGYACYLENMDFLKLSSSEPSSPPSQTILGDNSDD